VDEVPLAQFWHAVPSFPTMGEVWIRMLETYGFDVSIDRIDLCFCLLPVISRHQNTI
jgi:hypothetical protein